MRLTKTDEKVVKALQGDLPLCPEPFKALAAEAGVAEKAFLASVKRLLSDGRLRSLRAIVRHRRAGYKANAMVAWRVPAAQAESFGKTAAASQAVSHCYERLTRPGWDYNLYTMIHGRTKADIKKIVAAIAAATGVSDYRALESRREFKKTSMTYF